MPTQTTPGDRAYARIVLFRFTRRNAGYTYKDAQDARAVLGEKESDQVVQNAKNYRPNKFRRRVSGSFGLGKRR